MNELKKPFLEHFTVSQREWMHFSHVKTVIPRNVYSNFNTRVPPEITATTYWLVVHNSFQLNSTTFKDKQMLHHHGSLKARKGMPTGSVEEASMRYFTRFCSDVLDIRRYSIYVLAISQFYICPNLVDFKKCY